MLNTRELDILNILWNASAPMTSTDIVSAGNGLSQSTVQAVLRKLLKAELIQVSGITHSGNVLSRMYEPRETSKDLILQTFLEDYSSFSGIISKETLVSAMLQSDTDKEKCAEEIKRLKRMLEDLEKTL